jgi:hypothetical protein
MTEEGSRHLAKLGFALRILQESSPQRLVLHDLESARMSPLAVDFLDAKILHRLHHGLSKNQPLSRALGLRSLRPSLAPFVFDATAFSWPHLAVEFAQLNVPKQFTRFLPMGI